jgi:hypothetical protein
MSQVCRIAIQFELLCITNTVYAKLIYSVSASRLAEILQKSSDSKIIGAFMKDVAPDLKMCGHLSSCCFRIAGRMHDLRKKIPREETYIEAASAFLSFLYV